MAVLRERIMVLLERLRDVIIGYLRNETLVEVFNMDTDNDKNNNGHGQHTNHQHQESLHYNSFINISY